MAEIKTKATKESALKFLKSIEPAEKRADGLVLLKMFETITGEKAVMWGELGVGPERKGAGPTGPSRGRVKFQQKFIGGRAIVGFGMYHYKSERSTQEGDWPLAGFSPRKQNLTLYCMMGNEDSTALLKKLGKHKTSKGCLYINKLSDVDVKVLTTLIKKSYQHAKKVLT